MSELRRHQIVYAMLIPFVKVFAKLKFNYSYDDLRGIEGPYLLLANHNLELDPLVVALPFEKHMYFVASEHIMRKGLATKLLMYFLKPIIHQKGKQGVYTVKQMMKTLKSGTSVCIFPEGNRSFNGQTGEMMPAIGKVARRSGAKLVTLRVEGGYLTQPRWSTTLRRGKLYGRLMHVYSLDELKTMTDEQVNQAICDDLFEDAYETQKTERVAFLGKDLALGLETTIFTCPKCGEIGTLHSEDNRFWCDCGFHAIYDVYGDLTDETGKIYTVTDLDIMQRETLKKRMETQAEEDPFFSDTVTLYEIGNAHSIEKVETGTLTAYADRIECCGRSIPYKEMQGVAIYSRNSMIVHIAGREGHWEIKGGESFSALKYLYLYQMQTAEEK